MSPKSGKGPAIISDAVRHEVGVRFHAVWDAIQDLERTTRALSKTLLKFDECDIEPNSAPRAQRRRRKKA